MISDTVLVKLDKCRLLLTECHTAEQAKAISDIAEAARVYAKRVGASIEVTNKAAEYKIRAERKLGQILEKTPKDKGAAQRGRGQRPRQNPTLSDLNISKDVSSRAQKLSAIPEKVFERQLAEAKEAKEEISVTQIVREARREENEKKIEEIKKNPVKKVDGKYDVVVIDPSWPMEKIERDVRPNQTGLDYPVMSEDELRALKIPMADDCHIWLWTTHKFLPMGLRLLEAWGLKYVCTFVWHKPGGFQPIGLPQYNCEFALYARRGSPKFIDTKSFNTCFDAPRGKHSEKPEDFYSLVRRVTIGRKLDMYNRREIEGFDGYGNEAVSVATR